MMATKIHEYTSHIYSLQYQSYDIPFSKWVSLFTLSLAPLIAHIFAGAPRTFYLCTQRPKWHERLVHYNPTSVLWRYAAIADRRIRARNWNNVDIAAANAIFWTKDGWDGSEIMVDRSLPHCTHLPDLPRVALLSSDMLKTIIVTLQGVQTFVILIRALRGSGPSESFVLNMAVDFIFSPLSFIGLLRLASALWLTDDFNYTLRDSSELEQYPVHGEDIHRGSIDSILEPPTRPELLGSRYGTTSRWSSWAFRALYLVPVFAMLAISVQMITIAFQQDMVVSASAFLVGIFYIIFLASTSIICAYYLLKGSTSTILPCITSKWYKAYTAAVMVMATVAFVISCIETREAPCGRFTSLGNSTGDYSACYGPTIDSVWSDQYPITDTSGMSLFAVATKMPRLGKSPLEPGESWLYNFSGTCLGEYNAVAKVQELGTWTSLTWEAVGGYS